MTLTVTPSGQACGAHIEGIDLTQDLNDSQIAELRKLWLEHKVIALPNQALTPEDLERVAQYFGEVGEDPFFDHIDGYPNICAIQRNADEKTPIFAEIFHTDWSFMAVPPAGTALFGITIPPHGGDTLFADQVKAYEEMPDELRYKVEGLTAIHSAALGYAPDGAYGEGDQAERNFGLKTSDWI
jgi:taurine dioxygenase